MKHARDQRLLAGRARDTCDSGNEFRHSFVRLLHIRVDTVAQIRIDTVASRQCRDAGRRVALFNKQSRSWHRKMRFTIVPDPIRARRLGVVHLGEMARQKPVEASQTF